MMKMLNATRRNKRMSGLQAIQPKKDTIQKMKMPETTALAIHDALVAKMKYPTSATLANKTMSP
jgi:hypothetical protein